MKAESSVNTASQAEIEPLKDDPRVPQTTPFEMRRLDPDRLPPDYASLMSIFFAVIGLCFQVRKFRALEVESCGTCRLACFEGLAKFWHENVIFLMATFWQNL